MPSAALAQLSPQELNALAIQGQDASRSWACLNQDKGGKLLWHLLPAINGPT